MDVDQPEPMDKPTEGPDPNAPPATPAVEEDNDGTTVPFKRYNAMLAVMKNTLYM